MEKKGNNETYSKIFSQFINNFYCFYFKKRQESKMICRSDYHEKIKDAPFVSHVEEDEAVGVPTVEKEDKSDEM